MSELGDVLELLYKAPRSWTTVTAGMRQWSHRARTEKAFLRFAEQRQRTSGGVIGIRGAAPHEHDPPRPDVLEWRARVQIATPGRVRVEHEEVDGVSPIVRPVGTGNGERVIVSDHNPLEQFLDPTGLIAVLDIEITGRGVVAGRPVVVVEGTLRDPDARRPPTLAGLPPGADRYVLHVDAERGVLLRMEAFLAGEPFAATEITAIVFDEPIPDGVFASPPPAPDALGPPEAVSVEEAVRRAPFTVLVPARIPERSRLSARVVPAGGPRPFTVWLSYHLPGAVHHLELMESSDADGGREPVPWTEEHHPGHRLLVWEPPEEFGRASQVKVVRGGTAVRLMSDLDLAMLREIALSLEPAPTEPPTLGAR